MPIFLQQPGYRPGGPDGQGWNRLSLNAHGGLWDECGWMPTNHPTLFAAMTGRQRWGSFEPCTERGACGECPVQRRHFAYEGGVDWPEGVPLLLARIRPWPQTPGGLFGGLDGGHSDLELSAWNGGPPLLKTGWTQVLNTRGQRISWWWSDQESEAFWIVRNHPAADEALVHSEVGPAATRHELYGREGGPRMAVLTCQGACAHETYHLRHLAADLADHTADADRPPQPPPSLPERLPGVPLITLSHRDGSSLLRRPQSRDYDTSTLRIGWDVPFDELTATALVAHAVRLTVSA
ncbi:hypothetical protein [Streptomyces sp. NPDC056672]|uniref:hypothetical protein n=1 Tax=Streptomyces sp. NPDC056672 TaxID=3345906 RepID=UPI003694BC79